MRRSVFLTVGIAALAALDLTGCYDGTGALYDPDKTSPLSLKLELYASKEDSLPLVPNGKEYTLFAPCSTLKLAARVTSPDADGEMKEWSSSEIANDLRMVTFWWLVQPSSTGIQDTVTKYGHFIFVHCSEIRTRTTGHFLMADPKGDLLRDSLTILPPHSPAPLPFDRGLSE